MENSLTTRYPWYLQILPGLLVLTGIAMAFGLICLWWDIWDKIRHGNPEYMIMLFVFGIVGPLPLYIFFRMICTSWLLLYTYRLSNDTLEAYDPVLHRRYVVRFEDVKRVRCFFMGGPPQANAAFGRSLETVSGHSLPLCDALPLWPESNIAVLML